MRALQARCEQAGGLDLKLTVRETDDGTVPAQFLARIDGRLVGYCGVDRGNDAEVCGMVHPDSRRQGLAAALLGRSLAASAAAGYASALVICEDAFPAAIDWLRRRGGELDSTELRMVRRLEGPPPPAAGTGPSLRLRPAVPADRGALVALLKQGFGEVSPEILEAMVKRLDPAEEEVLVGSIDDSTVATLRLYHTPGRSMIYGLVVDESVRGRGYGRAAMRGALDILVSRGRREVSLEVLPDNQPALRLYRSLGFATSTTYRYLRLAAGAQKSAIGR